MKQIQQQIQWTISQWTVLKQIQQQIQWTSSNRTVLKQIPINHSPVNNATAKSAVTVKSLKSLINSSSDTELKARHSEIRSLSAQIAEQEKTLYQARHKVAPQNAQELNRIRALIIKLKYSLEEQTRQAEIEQVKLGYFDKSDPTVDNKSQKCIAYSGQDGSKVKFVGTCQFETIQF